MRPGEHGIDWLTCTADADCIGIQTSPDGACLAHLDEAGLEAALKRLGQEAAIDARGVRFRNTLLRRILRTLPTNNEERPIFHGEANFGGATFEDEAEFGQVIFKSIAWFAWTTFERGAGFSPTIFEGQAAFGGATFKGAATFSGATFKGSAGFTAIFEREAWFGEATFEDLATFGGTTFKRDAAFGGTTFKGHAAFEQAVFERDVGFNEATFEHEVRFSGATFQRARQLGPMLVRKSLRLDQALFHERAQVEVAAAAVCCQRTRFLAGVQLRVRWAQIVLDDADLAAPSILTGVPDPFLNLDEDKGGWARTLEQLQPTATRAGQPRLLSLRRADVAGLTVAGVDLRACRFIGAHHLDQLRLEEVHFAGTPRGWRWTTRQTIAEEHHWQATPTHELDMAAVDATSRAPNEAARSEGWYRPASRPPAWLEAEAPTPAQIAALYRALRKGREDNKDEPGAADFYYGEMEMRRHAKREEAKKARREGHYRQRAAVATERAVLWLYWLVSGYGLRAWRALTVLAVVIGLVGVGFSRVGFHHPHPSQVASWLYALQATVSLEGKARQLSGQLTLPGELLRVGLRFTGPVLLGLAVLSVRGRVKR